ncbi:MAG: 30S ribosomal protein S16 [Candidatus Roizmanbacteria bacterium]
MSVAIRLMRFGKKGFAFYRIVVLPKRSKRDGAYIEKVGLYNPHLKENTITIDKARVQYWIQKGAQFSEGLARLLKNKQDLIK